MLHFLFHASRLFLRQTADGQWLPPDKCNFTATEGSEAFTLGTTAGEECIAADVKEEEIPGLRLWDLREAYAVMPRHLYVLAGKAAELLYWDSHTWYCGKCGSPMQRSGVISKRCTICGEEVWPTVHPAVIVLIERPILGGGQTEALLVQARTFRRPFHGLVAGFVETGESLEECVRREVREETSLEIRDLRYFGSQPWPYPFGLMIGFRARYATGELRLADGELRHAAWYRATSLPELPPPPSIARRLIDTWAEEMKHHG